MEFFTADKHFGHKNILHHCKRPFNDIKENDETIIARNNERVTDSDTVYDLGDHAFRCSQHYTVECLKNMNGKRVIVWGNHDQPLRKALKNGLLDELLKSGKLELIGSPNKAIETSIGINIHNQQIILSHCAKRTWYGAFRGAYHLFGHSHGNLSNLYKSMDVGVDTNNFFPYSFEEIKSLMDAIDATFDES